MIPSRFKCQKLRLVPIQYVLAWYVIHTPLHCRLAALSTALPLGTLYYKDKVILQYFNMLFCCRNFI